MMGRMRKHLLIGLVLAAIVLGGCSENDPQVIFITGNQAVDSETQCKLQSTGLVTFKPFGYLDVSLANTYLLFPSLNTKLEDTTVVTGNSAQQLVLNSSSIQIVGAKVSYDLPVDHSQLGSQLLTAARPHHSPPGLSSAPHRVTPVNPPDIHPPRAAR